MSEFDNHDYTDEEVQDTYEMFSELVKAVPAHVAARGAEYVLGYIILFMVNETADFVEAELNEEFINMVHEAQAKMGMGK